MELDKLKCGLERSADKGTILGEYVVI
jgi:hypothetical protein